MYGDKQELCLSAVALLGLMMPFLWSLMQAGQQLRKKAYRYIISGALQHIGKDTDIDPSVIFESPGRIRIGDGCKLGQGARLIGASAEPISIDLGPLVRIRPYVSICAYGGRVSLARRVTIGEGSVICGHGELSIGENTMISWLCSVVPANHIFDRTDIPLRLQGEERIGIRIGSNVWVGSCATIVDGVNIGDNAIIGAGAVVTRNIPEWAVAVGVPARIVRDRREAYDRRPRMPTRVPTGESMTDVDDVSSSFL